MNELIKAIKMANTAIRTVQIIDIVKKVVIVVVTGTCFVLAFRYFRK